MVPFLQYPGGFLGRCAAGNLHGKFLAGNQHIHQRQKLFNVRVSAARVHADRDAHFMGFFRRENGAIQLVAVQMQILCLFQNVQIDVLHRRRRRFSPVPYAGAAAVADVQQNDTVEGQAGIHLHAGGIHPVALHFGLYKGAVHIIAHGAHIACGLPQLADGHQSGGAGAAALELGFQTPELGILPGKGVHGHQNIEDRRADANYTCHYLSAPRSLILLTAKSFTRAVGPCMNRSSARMEGSTARMPSSSEQQTSVPKLILRIPALTAAAI